MIKALEPEGADRFVIGHGDRLPVDVIAFDGQIDQSRRQLVLARQAQGLDHGVVGKERNIVQQIVLLLQTKQGQARQAF